jgi:hypothetical protein
MAKKPRKTLGEMAAEQHGKDFNPWACRSCGCCHWKVTRSQFQDGVGRRRERLCRNCGEPMVTIELPVKEDGS